MIANTLDDRGRAGISDCEALAGDSAEERFPAGRAVKHNVADQDIFFGMESRCFRRIDDQFSAGQAFADVIIGIAFER